MANPIHSDTSRSNPPQSWHQLSSNEALQILNSSSANGLTDHAVSTRLAEYGPNQLNERAPRPAWLKFLDQFTGFLILILIGAAILAGIIGDLKDAIVIGIVVLFNAMLGFFQEYRAEAALAALKNMLALTAKVKRNGMVQIIEAQNLVPGDILLLEAGDRVPADARILSAYNAEVSEAVLTGESHAVTKSADSVAEEAVLAERYSVLYMNTVITRGRLEAVVTATGMQTEMGRLVGLLTETSQGQTPLQIQLDGLGRKLAIIAGILVIFISGLGLIRGDGLVETLMMAIALAVAAIPEGLPAVVTVTLALGMYRMAKRHAIVKKLAAVETLGCTTVICSDKTGTLTLNQMTARVLYCYGHCYPVTGEGYSPEGHIGELDATPAHLDKVLLPAALCVDAQIKEGKLIGDPTEGALLTLAHKAGLDTNKLTEHFPRIAEIPFDSTTKFMATFHKICHQDGKDAQNGDGDEIQIWVKGAPDVLLTQASSCISNADQATTTLDDAVKTAYLQQNEHLAAQALRVLAIAGRRIPATQFDPQADLNVWIKDLTLYALIGIMDPPRSEAKDAIAVCHKAGIQVKMITGDHQVTAAAIAKELGLTGEVREGRNLDGLSQDKVAAIVEKTAVFARVTPEHKMRIVEALQAKGQVVAMTGDGVNDAPALKMADIGVAMGITGTEVTKEAATLVLTDDNFASIVHAVEEGRTIYDNIIKFVRFQLSTSIGAILTVLGGSLLGFPMPFSAIQILWVNIIMDGPPAMTLGIEAARPGIMQEAPRTANTSILSWQRMSRIGFHALIMATGTLALYIWELTKFGEAKAMTLALTTFVLFQFFNIFNARVEQGSVFNHQFFSNAKLWLALACVLALQVVVVHWAPAQIIFDTVDLTLQEWLLAAAVASSILCLDELRKLMLRIVKPV